MTHPYRASNAPTDPNQDDTEVIVYDATDLTVAVVWQSGANKETTTQMTFEGSKNPSENGEIVEVSRYNTPKKRSGWDEFFLHLRYSTEKGYFEFTDKTVVPWHRIFSIEVVKEKKREESFRWRWQEQKK